MGTINRQPAAGSSAPVRLSASTPEYAERNITDEAFGDALFFAELTVQVATTLGYLAIRVRDGVVPDGAVARVYRNGALVGGNTPASGVSGNGVTGTWVEFAVPALALVAGDAVRVELASASWNTWRRQDTWGDNALGEYHITHMSYSGNPGAVRGWPLRIGGVQAAQPKGVVGPLDASDFPVVTSLDQLLPGQVALLDNGTDPPRLARKRLDGSVPAFVNAVSEWPMLIASLGGEDGNQVAQHVDGPAFQRILLTPTVDTHNGWDAQNHRYLAPETGLYRIEMKMRVKDSGLPQGVSIGLGACDSGPSFLWSVSNANREGLMNQRVMALNKGNEVYLMCYIDRSGGADLAAAEMTIDRIR